MDYLIAGTVLGASLLHASWHALVKATGDRVVALAGMNVFSAGTALAFLLLTRPLPALAYLVIAGLVVLHASYKLGLAKPGSATPRRWSSQPA